MSFLHQNEGLPLQIVELQPLLPRQRVPRRQGHEQRLVEKRLRHQARPLHRQADERQIDFLREQRRRQLIGRVLVHHDLHRGKFHGKRAQPLRQDIGRHRRQHPERHLPPDQPAHFAHAVAGQLHFREHPFRVRPQQVPRRRERHLALRAREEFFAQFVLQFDDLLAQRGLGHVALLRRPAEIFRAGHREKVAQLMELHSFFLLLPAFINISHL